MLYQMTGVLMHAIYIPCVYNSEKFSRPKIFTNGSPIIYAFSKINFCLTFILTYESYRVLRILFSRFAFH